MKRNKLLMTYLLLHHAHGRELPVGVNTDFNKEIINCHEILLKDAHYIDNNNRVTNQGYDYLDSIEIKNVTLEERTNEDYQNYIHRRFQDEAGNEITISNHALKLAIDGDLYIFNETGVTSYRARKTEDSGLYQFYDFDSGYWEIGEENLMGLHSKTRYNARG